MNFTRSVCGALVLLPVCAAAACSSSSGAPQGNDSGSPDATGSGDATSDAPTSEDAASEAGSGDASQEAGPSDGGDAATTPADSGVPASVVSEPGFRVRLWAKGTTAYSAPDSIDSDGTHVWVNYQNHTTKDGSDGGAGFGPTSTVVEYSSDGATVVATYAVPGHADGLRTDPTTHKIWVSTNEDGNPHLLLIDPTVEDASAAVTEYTISGLTHGGGIDDMQFVNGKFYVVCSAPANGGTHVPAVGTFSIAGTTATFTPAFFDDSPSIPVGSDAAAPLALTDPDSLAIDDHGRLVLVSQSDNQLIFMTPVGDAGGLSLSNLPVPTQLDDTAWITKATGQLLLVDGTANAIYSISTTFTVGSVYTETPGAADSNVPGVLWLLDPLAGTITAQAIGFGKPTGLMFLPSP